jgi:vesicle-fusing ATPase
MLDWDFEKMGIGGLDSEFNAIFRRAFASRLYPPAMLAKLGWNPVRGVLLYGPPGTGKTLMARQIGKMLNGREPKIVAGPEVLNKFVGQSEENIRNLFKEAEEEQEKRGEDSDLHIIIMDELDAICRARGTRGDSTGVGDTVVNQLLAKIDGVNSLNNVLIIGMTNRLDMIDPALLRPGRLEVHIEIGLPDEHGRLQIFNIHTSKMRENGFLADDVDVDNLAARTKNYSGAEISGVVKNAMSWAMRRQVNPKELEKPPNIDELVITMEDFENSLTEVKPAFGVSKKDFDGLVPNGVVLHGVRMKRLVDSCNALLHQVQSSSKTRRVTALLAGPRGCGKTALASHLALSSGYPFVKLISPEQLVGLSEAARLTQIYEAFEAAYKSPLSVLVIDDVERLFDYVPAMPVRFSNTLLQGLSVLLGKPPPKDRRLCVIATTSNVDALKSLGVMESFDATFRVPLLESEQEYLNAVQDPHIEAFGGADAARVAAEMAGKPMPIKKLIMLAEMAKQGPKESYVDRFMEFAQEQEY